MGPVKGLYSIFGNEAAAKPPRHFETKESGGKYSGPFKSLYDSFGDDAAAKPPRHFETEERGKRR